MIKVNSHEAKLNFSQLMTQIANGHEVLITRSGQEFAKITPLKKTATKRVSGKDKGNAWIADDFNAPLPDSLKQYFE